MTLTPKNYIDIAFNYIATKSSNMQLSKKIQKSDLFVVWYCKTLQNSKALVGIHGSDVYIEITYNGDKDEVYFDEYIKFLNSGYKLEEVLKKEE